MSNLEIYNQRFTESGRRVFARALNGARGRGQNYVVVEHFIEALCAEEERLIRLLAGLLKIDLDQVQTMMAKRLENFPQKASGSLRLAPATIALLKHAWEIARNNQRPKIEAFDLILALARDDRSLLIELLKGMNADVEGAQATLQALDYCIRMLSPNIGDKKAMDILKEDILRINRGGGEPFIFIKRKDAPGPRGPKKDPRTRNIKRRDT
ncbi:MAG TPA: Clp protease N-terminal domain-containing protein [Blastocatellia bacterium]|nr:Clp protease N-terminal domain-containing protein [Blastocatellia bacterium]